MRPLPHAPSIVRFTTRSAIALALSLAIMGCGDAGEDAERVVRDSAGVRIVEHEAPTPPVRHLSEEPRLVLGALEGAAAEQLYTAIHALRLADGVVAVANQGTNELRFFSPDGQHIRTVGGEGGGPGEFEGMWGMIRAPGDSLVVWDWTAKRLTLYDATGALGRVVTTPVTGFAARLLGRLDDHHVLILAGFDPMSVIQRGGGIRDDSVRLLRVDTRDGAIADSLGPYPADQDFIKMSSDGFWMRPIVFGRNEAIDVAAGRIHVGNDRTGEVRSYGPDGQLAAILRLGSEPEPVTDAAEALYRERALEGVSEDRLAEERRRLAETPTAERFPAFDDLFADQVGRLWIRAFDPDLGPTRRWTVFDSTAAVTFRLDLPARFQPLDAGEDYVLFHTRDELDVERLLLYDLEEPAP